MFAVGLSKKWSLCTLFGLLVLISIGCIFLSLSLGSIDLSFFELKKIFLSSEQTVFSDIIFKLRLPRTLCAFTTGGLLALAGAFMQILLRNPLAEPYVLGVSGGAAVAVLMAMLLGISTHYLSGIAFIGSLCSLFIVMGLAEMRGMNSPLRLLLIGVVMASGWGAIISFILTVSPEKNLHGMLFWLMGDLSHATFSFWQIVVLGLGLFISVLLAKPLNVLCRGYLVAEMLGIDTKRMILVLYLTSAMLTASAVSIAGCISFIGLVVPHMLRLIGGSDHRFVLPASVLLGGSLLTVADTFARSLLAPIQLPVGILTAMIGVPVFLFLLRYGD